MNRSDAPCTYLIFGTPMAREVIHYPEVGRVGYIEGGAWRLRRTGEGVMLTEGKSDKVRPLTWWGSRSDRVT